MKKILLLTLGVIFLSGCASFGSRSQPVEIITTESERTRLDLEMPAPLSLSATKWIVVTPENANDVWKELEENNNNVVLFAITAEEYEKLSESMIDIRNYISTQRQIIIKYKEYYEPVDAE